MDGAVLVAVKAAWELAGPVVSTIVADYLVRRIRRRRLVGLPAPAGAVR